MAGQMTCRSCGASELRSVLSLGAMPLANALRTQDQLALPERRFPLELVFCRACTLVQITETVAPEALFTEYPYFSSFSDTMLQHSADLVRRLMKERGLSGSSLAAEVASNDGYLLQFYREAGIPVVGIEPAANVAEAAVRRGIRTVMEFFGSELAERLVRDYGPADVVHANNVIAHVADLNGVMQGLRCFVKASGVIVIEVPYVRDMIEGVEFDTVYHEHLCYFSLTALHALLRRHGLTVQDVERLNIHGGSLRLTVAIAGPEPAGSVAALLAEERELGMCREDFYLDFSARVERLKEELVSLLRRLRRSGSRIAAYGASAKGTTLLNYFGIGADALEFVADRSTVKQGRYTPGTHLPIRAPEALVDERPDYVLLLAWNFADEILRQQEPYRRLGGRFIIPIPALQIV